MRKGLGLLEVIVAIAMISLFFAVVAATTYSLRFFQENKFKTAASYILNASLDKMRSLPFSSLTPRTDAPLLGITFNFGKWETAADSNAPSTPNVLRLKESSATPHGAAAALITAPSSDVENGVFEAKIRLNASSTDSFAGLFFRSQNNHSYYRFVFNSELIKFEKINSDTPSILWQQYRTLATSTFYELKTSFSSSTIILYLDDLELATLNDSSFQKGDLGLVVTGDLSPSVDALSVTSGISFNWNFDNVTPPELPITWRRYSLYDLPDGEGFLTIENISENLKRIIVRIKWRTYLGERKLETQTLITSY